jgi:small-conductance mechanosensitive channel
VSVPYLLITRLLPETEKLMDMGVRVGLTVAFGVLVQWLAWLLIGRLVHWIERLGHRSPHAEQRGRTIGQILRNLSTVVIGGGVVVHSLAVLGWDVRPLLAGAGILSVALGFGAQTLVRDLIAGMFIIAEDQFGVGDLIEVDGKPATVEALTVRSTTLRDFHGFQYHVPNGEMKIVINRSRGWNRLAVDIPIASGQDVDRALTLVRRQVDAMNGDPAWRERMLDPIAVWGVEGLSGNEVLIRAVVRTPPGPDGPETARELRLRVHRALAEADIRTSLARELTVTTLPPTVPLAPSAQNPPVVTSSST